MILLTTGCNSVPYATVGVGYKLQELELHHVKTKESMNDPISARLEVGFEYQEWSYGLSHHSQYFSGVPFNDKGEYSKTELFVDYTWRFE